MWGKDRDRVLGPLGETSLPESSSGTEGGRPKDPVQSSLQWHSWYQEWTLRTSTGPPRTHEDTDKDRP